jgi:hypothetical protein
LGLTRRFGGSKMEELARVVPVVHSLGDIDAFVTLKADQFATRCGGHRLGEFRLADARLAFEQQRPLQCHREEYRGRNTLVGQVALLGEGGTDIARRHGWHVTADRPDRTDRLKR